MATNRLPNKLDQLITLAADMADGLKAQEANVGLKQNTEHGCPLKAFSSSHDVMFRITNRTVARAYVYAGHSQIVRPLESRNLGS